MALPGYCFNTNLIGYPVSTRNMVGGMSKKKKSRLLKNKKKSRTFKNKKKKSRTFKNKKKKSRTFKNKYNNRKLINTRSKKFSKKIKKQKGGYSLLTLTGNAVKNGWIGLNGGDNYSYPKPWCGQFESSYS
jgi:hypothetical protein